MREQVITHKVGDRGGMYGSRRSGAVAQRPTKRGGRGEPGAGVIGRLRAFAHYLPLVGKIALLVIATGLIFAGYRAAASASFFQVHQVDVRGTSRASADQIQQVVRRTVGQKQHRAAQFPGCAPNRWPRESHPMHLDFHRDISGALFPGWAQHFLPVPSPRPVPVALECTSSP